jgi:hypothetical protein
MRRAILTSAALIVGLIVVPAAASSAKSSPALVGTGITHCVGGWSGTLMFNPPLVTGGTSTMEELHLTAVVQPCTGGVPVPTSGNFIGKGIINGTAANDCNNWFATPAPPGGTDVKNFPDFGGAISWTPTSISGSSLSLHAIDVKTTALTSPVLFKAPVVHVTHSYPTTVGKFKFDTTQLLSTILSNAAGDCGNASGLSSVNIAGPGSNGKF